MPCRREANRLELALIGVRAAACVQRRSSLCFADHFTVPPLLRLHLGHCALERRWMQDVPFAPCLPCRSAVTALRTACIILHSGDAAEAGTASKHDQGQTCHAWSAPPILSPERLLLELDLRPNRLPDKVK